MISLKKMDLTSSKLNNDANEIISSTPDIFMHSLNIKIIGKGPPLVLLHGWGWHSGIWDPLVPKLKEKYQLFLIDLPGFGNSPLTDNFTLDEITNVLLNRAPKEATWLGWSMGGLFALWAAIHFPDRISNLITVTSSPRFMQHAFWPGLEKKTLEKFSHFLCIDHQQTLNDFLELQLRGSKNKDEIIFTLQNSLLTTTPASFSGLQAGLNLLRETDLREVAKTISCPNLHIFGQRDTIVPATIVNFLPTVFPKGQFEIIPRTGHMPFLSDPDHFVNLLNQFLG